MSTSPVDEARTGAESNRQQRIYRVLRRDTTLATYAGVMLSMPLIPVPTPSPTTEHIVVEVHSAAGSGWTAPVLAALLAGALAHVLTRKRDHSSWFRERLFDSTRKLNEHGRAFMVEGLAASKHFLASNTNEVPSLKATQHASGLDDLNAATDGYYEAINELQLLLRTEQFVMLHFDAATSMTSAHQALQNEISAGDVATGDTKDDYAPTWRTRLIEFRDAHNALMDAITENYFLMEKSWFKRWWRRTPVYRHPLWGNGKPMDYMATWGRQRGARRKWGVNNRE